MKTQRLSITMPAHTLAQVEARQARPGEEQSTDRSATIAKSLDRYFYALNSARRDLRERFSAAEQGLLIDVMNGALFASPCAIGFLEHEVADALIDGAAERWHVDGPALMKKLKALSYCEKLALIDAAERWLHRAGRGEQPQAGEMLD
ncbi:MAG: hypothetical protein GX774_11590 [Armatimonadetes bacterium]|nr:hypothetical protein [Armatimonadota bacterium]